MFNNIRSLVGEFVTLIELPTGYTAREYQVEIGGRYKVKDISGSNLCIELEDGITGHIHRGRFLECR